MAPLKAKTASKGAVSAKFNFWRRLSAAHLGRESIYRWAELRGATTCYKKARPTWDGNLPVGTPNRAEPLLTRSHYLPSATQTRKNGGAVRIAVFMFIFFCPRRGCLFLPFRRTRDSLHFPVRRTRDCFRLRFLRSLLRRSHRPVRHPSSDWEGC